MRIIGIDPGIATTGYGVIDAPFLKLNNTSSDPKTKKNVKSARNFSCISYGLIKTESSSRDY